MRYARWAVRAMMGAAVLLLLIVALAPQVGLAQIQALNRFLQTTGGSNDNILEINGTLEFEDKATVIDHGTTALVSGYRSVTTNLSSNVTCVVSFVNSSPPADDPNSVTAIYTAGSAVLEINAWKNISGTDPTQVSSTTTKSVAYVCMGAD